MLWGGDISKHFMAKSAHDFSTEPSQVQFDVFLCSVLVIILWSLGCLDLEKGFETLAGGKEDWHTSEFSLFLR